VEAKSQILTAADELFGERGFDATTTRDIAERSGVNKALIHYYFGTKDELLDAVLEGYYAMLGSALQDALARHQTLEAQVAALIDAYVDFLGENRAFSRIVQREVASGRFVARIVERTLPLFRLGIEWLGATVGTPPPGFAPVQVLVSIYGMVVTWFTYGSVIEQLTGADPFSPASLAERKQHLHAVVRLFLEKVAPQESP
jgi:TetR/AcrR family transcriptional regulator